MAVLLATASAGALGEPFRLVGDSEAVWLIVPTDDGHSLAVKPIDQPWVTRWGVRTGRVAAAAAVRDRVVIFFADGSLITHYPFRSEGFPGINAPKELWPSGTLAVAACPDDQAGRENVLVLVKNVRVGFPATRPATAPSRSGPESQAAATGAATRYSGGTGRDASAGSATSISSAPATSTAVTASAPTALNPLALLRYAEGNWQEVAVVPGGLVRVPFRPHVARHGETIYVLLDQKPVPVLIALAEGAWRILRLPPDAVGAKPLALVGAAQGIVLASLWPGGQVGFNLYASGRWGPRQIVHADKGPLTWADEAAPAVTRLGKGLALIWRSGQEWSFATCGLDGKVSPKQEDIFGARLAAADAARILQHFFTGVLIVLIVLMFWPGQTVRSAPFSLPPTIVPAALGKRVFAFVIDAFPFLLLAFLIFGGMVDVEVSWRKMLSGSPVPEMVYPSLAFLTSYPLYCILLEARYGATLGKMAMRLRVAGDGGRAPLLREVALRNISKIPEIMAVVAVIPILFPVVTRYHQRLGDKIAWTTVIDAEASVPPQPTDDSTGKTGPGDDSGKGPEKL